MCFHHAYQVWHVCKYSYFFELVESLIVIQSTWKRGHDTNQSHEKIKLEQLRSQPSQILSKQ